MYIQGSRRCTCYRHSTCSPSSRLGKDHQLVSLTPQTGQFCKLACQCSNRLCGGEGRGGEVDGREGEGERGGIVKCTFHWQLAT